LAEVLVDTSTAVKWFRTEGEDEVAAAQALIGAREAGRLTLRVLDLTYYELGNVLVQGGELGSDEIAAQLDDLALLCGAGLALTRELRESAARVALADRLTFYDAAYVAVARGRSLDLVTADQAIIAAGGGETATGYVARMGL